MSVGICLLLNQPLGLAPFALPCPGSAEALVGQKPVLSENSLLGVMAYSWSAGTREAEAEAVQFENNLENTQPHQNANCFFLPSSFCHQKKQMSRLWR